MAILRARDAKPTECGILTSSNMYEDVTHFASYAEDFLWEEGYHCTDPITPKTLAVRIICTEDELPPSSPSLEEHRSADSVTMCFTFGCFFVQRLT